MKKHFRSFIFALLCSTLLVILLDEIEKSRRNTLYNNGNWNSTKVGLDLGTMGSASFLLTRMALSGNRLHFDPWFGHHELFYKDALLPTQIEFKFEIEQFAHLDLLLKSSNEKKLGLRLLSGMGKSFLFEESRDGKFLKSKMITELEIAGGQSECLHLILRENSIILINKGDSISINWLFDLSPVHLGFRGGMHGASIDDLLVKRQDSPVNLVECFSAQSKLSFAQFLGAIGLLTLILLLFELKIGFNNLLICMLNVLFVLVIWHQLELNWFSHNYPKDADLIEWKEFESNIEDRGQVHSRLESLEVDSSKTTWLFTGSSQTWGAGASSIDQTFVSKLQIRLDQDYPESEIRLVNTAVSGLVANDLLVEIRLMLRFKPEKLIVNLSNNDFDGDLFRGAIYEMIRIADSAKIDIYFLLEPNSPEIYASVVDEFSTLAFKLNQNHSILKSICQQHQKPLIDAHLYMQTCSQHGHAWWDFVHLSNFGHQCMTDLLWDSLFLPIFQSKLKDSLETKVQLNADSD